MLLIDTALYYFDPEGFHAIAHETGSKLAIVNDPREAGTLLQRLLNGASTSGLFPASSADSCAAILEADTAKYHKNTVHEQLEIMRKMGEADTLKLDRNTVQQQIESLRGQTGAVTAKYDRATVREQLARLREEEGEPGSCANARDDHEGS